jgi:hypothetical protein
MPHTLIHSSESHVHMHTSGTYSALSVKPRQQRETTNAYCSSTAAPSVSRFSVLLLLLLPLCVCRTLRPSPPCPSTPRARRGFHVAVVSAECVTAGRSFAHMHSCPVNVPYVSMNDPCHVTPDVIVLLPESAHAQRSGPGAGAARGVSPYCAAAAAGSPGAAALLLRRAMASRQSKAETQKTTRDFPPSSRRERRRR